MLSEFSYTSSLREFGNPFFKNFNFMKIKGYIYLSLLYKIMRRIILDSIISLDGYYTNLKNEIDWFDFDKDEIEWSNEILRRVDTMLFGRITYEEFSEFWPNASPSSDGFDSEIIGHLNNKHKIVFSNTLKEANWKPATLIRDDPAVSIRKIKNMAGMDMVVVGSGTLVATLIRNNLVDEYRIRVRPIILGSGKPLFRDDLQRHRLKLISFKALKNGVIALHYEPES